MVNGFAEALRVLERIGFMDLIVPFVLFFAVFYGILLRINIFRKDGTNPDRKTNAIISLTLSLAIVLPHAGGMLPSQWDPILLLNSIIPSSSMIIIVALLAVLLIGFVGGDKNIPNVLTGLVGIASLIALVLVALYAIWPQSPQLNGLFSNPAMQSAIIILVVLGVIVWFVMRPDRESDTLHGSIDNLFRGFGSSSEGGPVPPRTEG